MEYKGIGYKDQLILSVRYALATPEECRSLNSRFGDYGIRYVGLDLLVYWLRI